jgi:hypothetical protein
VIVGLVIVAALALAWAGYLTQLIYRGPRSLHNVDHFFPNGYEVLSWHWLRGWRMRYRVTQTTTAGPWSDARPSTPSRA